MEMVDVQEHATTGDVAARPTVRHRQSDNTNSNRRPTATTLTVPARPAMVTGANAVALAASSVVAAGATGAIAVAAGVAAVGGVAIVKGVRGRGSGRSLLSRSSRPRSGGTSGSMPGPRRLGRSSAGGTVYRSGATRARTAGPVAATRRAAAGAAGWLGLGRMPSRTSRSAGGSGSGRTSTPSVRTPRGQASGRASVPRTAVSRPSASRPSAGRPGGASTATASGRSKPKRPIRDWVGRLAARAARRGWKRLRKWFRRNILGIPDKPAKATKPKPERKVGATVSRPDTTTPTPKTTTHKGDTPMAPGAQLPTLAPSSPVYDAARRFHAVAADYHVKGTLELRGEMHELHHTIAELAAGIRARVAECQVSAVDPTILEALVRIASVIDTAAQTARQIGPAFDEVHHAEIHRLVQPRQGEAKWDTANNPR